MEIYQSYQSTLLDTVVPTVAYMCKNTVKKKTTTQKQQKRANQKTQQQHTKNTTANLETHQH